jgi:hypothetical protein
MNTLPMNQKIALTAVILLAVVERESMQLEKLLDPRSSPKIHIHNILIVISSVR